jgi:5-formyltetrahydrofolate cyclo-ligase
LSEAARQSADRAVQAFTLALVRARQPTVCAAYAPIGTEPGGGDLPARLAECCTVLLPVLLPDGDLDWTRYDGTLHRSERGLLEPDGPTLGRSGITRAELIVVPAVAVSPTGMRLGRGGGSYDRALARAAESAFVVALLHDGELVDQVPYEPHDRPVDAVITPSAGCVVIPG